MDEPTTVSFEELEALHDVLEAARCYWYQIETDRERAAMALRLVNQLYWRIGEYLPTTGQPSERFLPVKCSSDGSVVERILEIVLQLTRECAITDDPWGADTVFASQDGPIGSLSSDDLSELRNSLRRLGLTLDLRFDIPPTEVRVARQNLGPWYQDRE